MNSHRKTLAWYLAKPKQTAPLLQTLQSPARCHNFYLPLPTTATFPGAAPAEFPNGQVWRCQWITWQEKLSWDSDPSTSKSPFLGLWKWYRAGRHSSASPYHQCTQQHALRPVQSWHLTVLWHSFLLGSSKSRWNIGIRMSQTGPLGPFLSNIFILSKLYLIVFRYCCF